MNLIDKNWLPDKKHFFWVACSGGVDSVVLAHVLKQLNYKFGLLHVNHKLRPQNDVMASEVLRFAHHLGVSFQVVDRPLTLVPKGVSLEDALHVFRQAVYVGMGCDVVTAHHLNDAVESYMMNCFKGQAEYTPIKRKSVILDRYVWRPMLQAPKSRILQYAQYHNLKQFVVEDETNADNGPLRNRLRNQVLPLLKDRGLEKVVFKKFYNDTIGDQASSSE